MLANYFKTFILVARWNLTDPATTLRAGGVAENIAPAFIVEKIAGDVITFDGYRQVVFVGNDGHGFAK